MKKKKKKQNPSKVPVIRFGMNAKLSGFFQSLGWDVGIELPATGNSPKEIDQTFKDAKAYVGDQLASVIKEDAPTLKKLKKIVRRLEKQSKKGR